MYFQSCHFQGYRFYPTQTLFSRNLQITDLSSPACAINSASSEWCPKEQAPHRLAESPVPLPCLSPLWYLHPLTVQASPLVHGRRYFLFKSKVLKQLEHALPSFLRLKLENSTDATQTLGHFRKHLCSCCSIIQRLSVEAENQSPERCLLSRA